MNFVLFLKMFKWVLKSDRSLSDPNTTMIKLFFFYSIKLYSLEWCMSYTKLWIVIFYLVELLFVCPCLVDGWTFEPIAYMLCLAKPPNRQTHRSIPNLQIHAPHLCIQIPKCKSNFKCIGPIKNYKNKIVKNNLPIAVGYVLAVDLTKIQITKPWSWVAETHDHDLGSMQTHN